MRSFVVLLFVALLSGCASPPPPAPQPDSCFGFPRPSFEPSDWFLGQNAFAHVLAISCDWTKVPPAPDGRVPGTPGRERAATHLYQALVEAGWRAQRIAFTGADYLALPRDEVRPWEHSCPDPERVPGLRFENVVADIGEGRDVTLLMAHYDTKRYASMDPVPANRSQPVNGANDGGSGVGVLLEAARVWGRDAPGTRLRILLVDGEDGFEDCHPLAGSIHYAYHHPPQPDHALPVGEERIVRVVLLDMVGDPEARFCYSHNNATLRDRWVRAARTAGVGAFLERPDCSVTDDHTSFANNYPVLDVIDYARPTGFPPYWHTTHDTPDKITPARLEETGRTLLQFVRDLSGP